MSNKRRVMLTIHHRDELSLGPNRTRLGYAAYHWGILIQPKKPKGSDSNAYDVSNGAKVDPLTRQDLKSQPRLALPAQAESQPCPQRSSSR
jgi:hypothetical protein